MNQTSVSTLGDIATRKPVVVRRTVRAIAIFEAIKGFTALAAMLGLVDLMHHDVRRIAADLIGHFGWNPHARYSTLLLHYADLLPDADLRLLYILGSAYVIVRLTEAYGLWKERSWGEALGAFAGGIYIPFEIVHLAHRPSFAGAIVLALNVFLVGYLGLQLRRRYQKA